MLNRHNKQKIIAGVNYSNIPSNSGEVTNIGWGAFVKTSGGTTLKIPINITEIDFYAFSKCSSIVSVELLVAIDIRSAVFSDCTNLTTIYYAGTQENCDVDVNIYTAYNDPLMSSTTYFYSETELTTEDNYWHYVDGAPADWTTIATHGTGDSSSGDSSSESSGGESSLCEE